MQIDRTTRDDVTVLAVAGWLDATTAPALETALQTEMQAGVTRLVLDFSQVQLISSAALRVLVSAAKQMKRQHGRILLCALTPEVAKVFGISGLASLFDLHPTQPAALAALGVSDGGAVAAASPPPPVVPPPAVEPPPPPPPVSEGSAHEEHGETVDDALHGAPAASPAYQPPPPPAPPVVQNGPPAEDPIYEMLQQGQPLPSVPVPPYQEHEPEGALPPDSVPEPPTDFVEDESPTPPQPVLPPPPVETPGVPEPPVRRMVPPPPPPVGPPPALAPLAQVPLPVKRMVPPPPVFAPSPVLTPPPPVFTPPSPDGYQYPPMNAGPAPVSPSKAPLIAVGVIAAVLALLGLGWVVMRGFGSKDHHGKPTPKPTPTVAPTPTEPPTPTETPTPTPVDTPTATPMETPTPTMTVAPTETPLPTAKGTPSPTPTARPTDTPAGSSDGNVTVLPEKTIGFNPEGIETGKVRDAVVERIKAMPITAVQRDRLNQMLANSRGIGKIITIRFENGHADLNDAAINDLKAALRQPVIRTTLEDPSAVFVVLGYADSKGTPQANKEISDRRAANALAALRGKCGMNNMMHAIGMGGSEFLDKQHLEKNRVVEVWAVLP